MKVTALCLVGAVLAALLKKGSPELALLLALAACAAVLLALVRGVETVTAFVREVMQWGGVESALFAPLFKTVAIALISRTGADLCRDAGEGAMASLVETAGAFGAVVVSLPLFGAVWELLSDMMRKWTICALAVLALLGSVMTASAQELTEALPPEAQELLDGLEEENAVDGGLGAGLARLWEKGCESFLDILRQSLRGVVLLLGAVLVCGVAEDCLQAAGSEVNYVSMAGALVVTALTAGSVRGLMTLGMETIEQLDVFSKALLPTLAAAVAASGGIVSAGVKQVATAFFAELLITLIRNVFMPLVYVCAAAASAEAMLPGHGLGRIGKGVSKAVTWVLTGALILFTGYLAVSGALSGSSDALTAQLTKNAISTAVPVVGGIISDAAGSVLAGALVLKNAVGAFGMLAVLAICLLPFLRLAVQYLLYKLTAFLAATVGSAPLVGLIDALGSAFGLVLGMAGCCSLLLLISIASSVQVVVS